jgi:hypothetical protein
VGSGKLVVATVASQVPEEVWKDYEPLFHELGVKKVVHLDVNSREEAKSPERLKLLDNAAGIFFTGGDQLKLTSQLGDSPIYERLREIYRDGGVIAGTSAGASVVCETMLVGGAGEESHQVGTSLRMAPGFGLIPGVIIDQHFAQRGRIGRLVAGQSREQPRGPEAGGGSRGEHYLRARDREQHAAERRAEEEADALDRARGHVRGGELLGRGRERGQQRRLRRPERHGRDHHQRAQQVDGDGRQVGDDREGAQPDHDRERTPPHAPSVRDGW